MSKKFRYIDFIDDSELDLDTPKTFSTVVNNDDILQMYLKQIGKKKILTKMEEMELRVPLNNKRKRFDRSGNKRVMCNC